MAAWVSWGCDYALMSDNERVTELLRLVEQWREPSLAQILPSRVVPDSVSRQGTGISPKHAHLIATAMQGSFTLRDEITGAGHDLPIVIRETGPIMSEAGTESCRKWESQQKEDDSLPQMRVHTGGELFCSLCNSHFFQALNLFGSPGGAKAAHRVFTAAGHEATAGNGHYTMVVNSLLHVAVTAGVDSIVLSGSIPKAHRRFISQMCNSATALTWSIDAEGVTRIDHRDARQGPSSFEVMAKHADAWELEDLAERQARKTGLQWAHSSRGDPSAGTTQFHGPIRSGAPTVRANSYFGEY